jgi:DNA-binding MarR family transcriptional regulator
MTNKPIHRYTTVYFDVAARFGLSPLEMLIMSYIYGLSHQGSRGCYSSQKTMGKLVGVSETTININIMKLERADLIIKIDRGDNRKLEYKTSESWNLAVQEAQEFLGKAKRVRWQEKHY